MWPISPLLDSLCILSTRVVICSSNPKGIIKVSQSFQGINSTRFRLCWEVPCSPSPIQHALSPHVSLACVQSRGSGKKESIPTTGWGHPSIHVLLQDGALGLWLWDRGLLWRDVTSWATNTLPHTCGINISFNNDADTQMCLLCQLPGLAFCLPLISPPRVRAALLSHGPDAHRPAGPGWAKGADLI